MQEHSSKLQELPVELLYEVQLYALSPSLPCLSRYFVNVFSTSPASYRVQYLLASCITATTPSKTEILSKAMRYPLCTIPVLDLLCLRLEAFAPPIPLTHPLQKRKCELPRRLFRSLRARQDDNGTIESPIPFLLLHILNKPSFPPIDVNSHQGYGLTRAVHARHVPLVRLLLENGASPGHKDGMAIKVAIRQQNLTMVKMLVEREDQDRGLALARVVEEGKGHRGTGKGKRRRLEDRVRVDQSMLKLAVRCNARDIIDYLAWEKGVVPDIQTLAFVGRPGQG